MAEEKAEEAKQRVAGENVVLLRQLQSLDAQIVDLHDYQGQPSPAAGEREGRRKWKESTPAAAKVSARPDTSLHDAQVNSERMSTPLSPLRRTGSPRALARAMVMQKRAFIG